MSKKAVSILTMNLGLMQILGYSPIPHVKERLAAFPQHAKKLGADIICLQEVWNVWQYEQLQKELKEIYPYSNSFPFHKEALLLPSGLCIFSQYEIEEYPLQNETHIVFAGFPAWHEYLVSKGAIAVHVHTPVGLIAVINTHLVSGGPFFAPNGRPIRKMRAGQIHDLVHFTKQQLVDLHIIAGDLNAGPAHSVENYELILQHGFVDTKALAPAHAVTGEVTFDTRNILHLKEDGVTSGRLDHIFLSQISTPRIHVKEHRVVFFEEIVHTRDGQKVPLSDHYGLFVHCESR